MLVFVLGLEWSSQYLKCSQTC